MSQVKVIFSNQIFNYQASTGGNFLLEATSSGVPIPFKCTKGNCAKCWVKIESGQENINEPTEREYAQLGEDGIAQGFRLACQCYLTGDVVAAVEDGEV